MIIDDNNKWYDDLFSIYYQLKITGSIKNHWNNAKNGRSIDN